MACITCGSTHQINIKGAWQCADCGKVELTVKRRGLTDYERLKLSWYRNELAWEDHIRSRQLVTDATGQKRVIIPGKGEVPTQPREYWPKPKQVEQ